MGLTGAVANTAGFISPYIAGIVVDGNVSEVYPENIVCFFVTRYQKTLICIQVSLDPGI